MNTPVLFLLGAVALSALGGLVVWIASRPRPEKFGSSIDTFNRDLDALAPPGRKPPRPSAARPRNVQAQSQTRQTATPKQPGPRRKPGPRPQAPRS